jgi:hypothetical protein
VQEQAAKRMSDSPTSDNNRPISNGYEESKVARKASTFSPRAIIVLGMHRSGTSAMTRVLSLLGADLPKNLVEPLPSNETGHWESWDWVRIHDEMLASAGTKYDDWRPFNPDWNLSNVAGSYKQRLLDLLEKDVGRSPLFVIKDPRICRFTPVWLDVLARFGATPVIVTPLRNPMEVAASLARRNGFAPCNSYLIWLRHVLDAEAATRAVPRAFVNYEDLIGDWRTVVAAISARTGLHWPRKSDYSELEIDRFLAVELRHHVIASAELAARSDVAGWVKETYAVLRQLASEGDSEEVRARLDQVRGAFDAAAVAFGRLLASEAEDSRAKLAAAEAQAGARDEEVARLVSDRDRLAAALEEQKTAAAQHAEQAVALAHESEGLQGALREHEEAAANLAAELNQAQAASAEYKNEIDRLGGELIEVRATAEARQREIDRLGGELTSARAVVKDRNGAIARLTHDVEATRGYLRESQTQLQRLTGELDGARNELQHGETERARLAKIAADGAAELDTARSRIVALKGERDELRTAATQLPMLRAQIEALKKALEDARGEADRRDRHLADLAAGSKEQFAHTAALEERLAEASSARRRLSDELTRIGGALVRAIEEKRRSEQSAGNRIAAIEASRTAALAEGEKTAQRRIRALQDQLIDAEAAVSKYKKGRRNGPFWTRHLSLARHSTLRQITNSGLFDADWYAREYPEVAASGRSPAEHYLEEGYLRGYRPNPFFDTRWYLERYEDVRRAGINPLLHYIHIGALEGRDPSPDFHTDFYLVSNPDVRASGMNPLHHYLRYGRDQGRQATRPGAGH